MINMREIGLLISGKDREQSLIPMVLLSKVIFVSLTSSMNINSCRNMEE